jgi:hypothetical protein
MARSRLCAVAAKKMSFNVLRLIALGVETGLPAMYWLLAAFGNVKGLGRGTD